MPKQPNGTPDKKPPAPSVKIRLTWTPVEQRAGRQALRRPADKQTEQAGRRVKPVPGRRGRG